jgi:hypothetical protein
MRASDFLWPSTLSYPSSDGVAAVRMSLDNEYRDSYDNVELSDLWGDELLMVSDVGPSVSPFISSSPAGFPVRADILSIETDPEKVNRRNDSYCDSPGKQMQQKFGSFAQRGKPRPNFSHEVKTNLLAWLAKHESHPYPDQAEIEVLARTNKLTVRQVRTFLVNNRMRKLRVNRGENEESSKKTITAK